LTIVQDPQEALYPDLPRNALAAINVDHVLSAQQIREKSRNSQTPLFEEAL
jgi:CheB methylesterase